MAGAANSVPNSPPKEKKTPGRPAKKSKNMVEKLSNKSKKSPAPSVGKRSTKFNKSEGSMGTITSNSVISAKAIKVKHGLTGKQLEMLKVEVITSLAAVLHPVMSQRVVKYKKIILTHRKKEAKVKLLSRSVLAQQGQIPACLNTSDEADFTDDELFKGPFYPHDLVKE